MSLQILLFLHCQRYVGKRWNLEETPSKLLIQQNLVRRMPICPLPHIMELGYMVVSAVSNTI